jgi:hypothetical protein
MNSKTLRNTNSAFYHPVKDMEPNVNTAADRVPYVEHALEKLCIIQIALFIILQSAKDIEPNVFPMLNIRSKTLLNPNSAFYHPAKDIEPNVNTAADRVLGR